MKQRPELHIPACLTNITTPPQQKQKRESAAVNAARRALNRALEDAALEIEALARNFPSWAPALSSASQRVRERKLETGQLKL
jgi:hypothetical protein